MSTGHQGKKPQSPTYQGAKRSTGIRGALGLVVAVPLTVAMVLLGFRTAGDVGRYQEAADVASAAQLVTDLSRIEAALTLEQIAALDLVSITPTDFVQSPLLINRERPSASDNRAAFEQAIERTDAALAEADAVGDFQHEVADRADELKSIRDRTLASEAKPAEINRLYDRFTTSADKTKERPTLRLGAASSLEVQQGVADQKELTDAAMHSADLRRDLTSAATQLVNSAVVDWKTLGQASRETRVVLERVDQQQQNQLDVAWPEASSGLQV